MAKEQWEIDLEDKLCALIDAVGKDDETAFLNATVQVKNFVQKERIEARLKENQAWSRYYKEVKQPEMCTPFDAMIMKYGSLLERF